MRQPWIHHLHLLHNCLTVLFAHIHFQDPQGSSSSAGPTKRCRLGTTKPPRKQPPVNPDWKEDEAEAEPDWEEDEAEADIECYSGLRSIRIGRPNYANPKPQQ